MRPPLETVQKLQLVQKIIDILWTGAWMKYHITAVLKKFALAFCWFSDPIQGGSLQERRWDWLLTASTQIETSALLPSMQINARQFIDVSKAIQCEWPSATQNLEKSQDK